MLRVSASLPDSDRAAAAVMIWQQIFSVCSVSYVLARSLFGDSRLVCWTL